MWSEHHCWQCNLRLPKKRCQDETKRAERDNVNAIVMVSLYLVECCSSWLHYKWSSNDTRREEKKKLNSCSSERGKCGFSPFKINEERYFEETNEKRHIISCLLSIKNCCHKNYFLCTLRLTKKKKERVSWMFLQNYCLVYCNNQTQYVKHKLFNSFRIYS